MDRTVKKYAHYLDKILRTIKNIYVIQSIRQEFSKEGKVWIQNLPQFFIRKHLHIHVENNVQ